MMAYRHPAPVVDLRLAGFQSPRAKGPVLLHAEGLELAPLVPEMPSTAVRAAVWSDWGYPWKSAAS